MKIRLFILQSLILLSLLTLQAFSQTPSQPISGYDEVSGTLTVGGGSVSEQAQASRAAHIGQPGKEILSAPFGNNPSSGASTPQAKSQEQNQTVPTHKVAADANVHAKPAMSSELAIVSGSWSLELNDSTLRKVALTLFQNGDAVYGTGNINLDANNTMTVAASGTVTGDKASLDIVSLGKVSLYRISMTMSGDTAIGSYTAFSPSAASTTGALNGVRSVPSS